MIAKLRVIEDCWRVYADAVVPAAAPDPVRGYGRSAFYAGVAFMFDIMMANCDDEDSGAAMLDSVHAELEEYSSEMATRAGVNIAGVREAIAAELRRKR